MCERPNEDTFGRSLSPSVVIVLVVVLESVRRPRVFNSGLDGPSWVIPDLV